MGAQGGLYRSTPQGYNGNPAGRGPSRQSLWPPSYPPTPGARRLVGPADWLGTEPTGRVRRGRVLPAVDYCSRASNDAGSVMGSWRQLRRLAGDHCGHSLSHLVNGAWDPWEGPADSWGPTPNWADWWRSRRLPYARRLVGPAVPGPYRQAVVGTGLRPLGLTSGPAWQQCRAGQRSPRVRRTVATPALGKGWEWTLLWPLPVPSLFMRAWGLLASRADSPWTASLEVASQESAHPEVVPVTRPRVGSRLPHSRLSEGGSSS